MNRKLKRLFSIVLTLVMLISGASSVFATRENNLKTFDYDLKDYYLSPEDIVKPKLDFNIDSKGVIEEEKSETEISEPLSAPMRSPAMDWPKNTQIRNREDFMNLYFPLGLSNLVPSDYQPCKDKTCGDKPCLPYDAGPSFGYITMDKNDNYKYYTDIYLMEDIVISSDDVNVPIPGNKKDPIYNIGLGLSNCNFHGGGHTITIKKGERDIYPLFRELTSFAWGKTQEIKDLNIVYEGDVVGSAFAMSIPTASSSKVKISNVNVTVKGSILPYVNVSGDYNKDEIERADIPSEIKGDSKRVDSENFAVGLARYADNVEIDGYKLKVEGDIGSPELKKHPCAVTEHVHSIAAGLFYKKQRKSDIFTEIKNVNIEVDGGIYSHSNDFRAESYGVAQDLQHKRLYDLTLKVGKDIEAVATGKNNFSSDYRMWGVPSIASGVSNELHHLERADINVGGDIKSVNETDIVMETFASGIAKYDYDNGYKSPDDPQVTDENNLQKHPLTVKNVKLNVGGSVRAESKKEVKYKPKDEKEVGIGTQAVGGMLNDYNGGLINFDDFSKNEITINGDIIANSNYGTNLHNGFSRACLWGYFIGGSNKFSANSINSTAISNTAFGAPFIHYLNGLRNTVNVPGGINLDSLEDYGGGYALNLTNFSGVGAKAYVTKITSTHPAKIGGFAATIIEHPAHKDKTKTEGRYIYVKPLVRSVNVEPTIIINSDAKNYKTNTWVGGFVGDNYGIVQNSSVLIKEPIEIKTMSDVNLGGFVGYNEGKIILCAADVKSISVDSSDNNINAGGFCGYSWGDTIKNSSVLVEDSIKSNNGYEVNLGGFRGMSVNFTDDNNAAQVGEDIISTNNNKKVYLGGYAGRTQAAKGDVSVDNSTSLVFGSIKGETKEAEHTSMSGGFIGMAFGGDYKNSAAYTGGEIISANVEGWSKGKYKNLLAGSIGWLAKANIENFTVLANKTDPKAQNVVTAENYIGITNKPFKAENLYYVEVGEETRTSYPVTYNEEGFFSKGQKVGEISIAKRDFQDNYWGKDASKEKTKLPYQNFDYVKDNGGLTFEGFSNAADYIKPEGAVDFSKLTLKDYLGRNLAIRNNNIVYDILGIKYTEPTVEPDPGPGPGPGPGPEPDPGPGPGPNPKPDPNPNPQPKPIEFVKVEFDENDPSPRIIKTLNLKQGTSAGKEFPSNPERRGYKFFGWNTKQDGSGKTFTKDTIVNGNIRLYAIWKKLPDNIYDPGFILGSSHSNTLQREIHKAYIKGYPDNTIMPQGNMTRAEAIAVVVRLQGYELGDKGETLFNDTKENAWYNEYINAAFKAGILEEKAGENIRPDEKITRAELAKLISPVDKKVSEGTKAPFADINGHKYEKEIIQAYNNERIKGYPDGTFRPDEEITRAEVATMINRLYDRYPDKKYIDENEIYIPQYRDLEKTYWAYYELVEAYQGHEFTRIERMLESWSKLIEE